MSYSFGMEIAEVPPAYQDIVARYGPPVEVEDARSRWSTLVKAAEAGTVTLLTPAGARYLWSALVPMSEVAEPVTRLPMWPLSTARAKLGTVMSESTCQEQVLTRHRRPVAAIIGAGLLCDRPDPADRIDAEKLMEAGRRIVLQFSSGTPGQIDYDGEVIEPPERPCYSATAIDWDNNTVASGIGSTIGEALLCLTKPHEPLPDEYADEPPF
jgi:antitoxin (DNA-binding transcriptional repressor) of toxin-antitoxin stability system